MKIKRMKNYFFLSVYRYLSSMLQVLIVGCGPPKRGHHIVWKPLNYRMTNRLYEYNLWNDPWQYYNHYGTKKYNVSTKHGIMN